MNGNSESGTTEKPVAMISAHSVQPAPNVGCAVRTAKLTTHMNRHGALHLTGYDATDDKSQLAYRYASTSIPASRICASL